MLSLANDDIFSNMMSAEIIDCSLGCHSPIYHISYIIYQSCQVMSCHVMSCHVMSCHVMSSSRRKSMDLTCIKLSLCLLHCGFFLFHFLKFVYHLALHPFLHFLGVYFINFLCSCDSKHNWFLFLGFFEQFKCLAQ